MRTRAWLLAGLVGLAALVAIVGWMVRFQPFAPSGPLGTPLPSGAPAASGWVQAAEAPFARLEMATAVHGRAFWLAGGLAPDGAPLDAVNAFDPATGEWTDGPDLPEAVHHAALASDGARLYLVGGYLASGAPTNAVRTLDPDAGEWTDGPALLEPRAAGALAFDGDRMVYAGGVGPGGVRGEVLVLDNGEWRVLGELAQPREHLAAASDGAGRVWFLGGRVGGLDRNLGDVDLVEGDAVTRVAELTPRGGVAAYYSPALGACLTGGEAPSFAFSTVECVDAAGRITALPEMSQRRHGHGAGVIAGVAYALLGGEVPGLHATATVESLRLE